MRKLKYLILLLSMVPFSCGRSGGEGQTESRDSGLYPGPVKSELLLKTATAWDGSPIRYPEGEAEVSALVIEIEPGGETGLHLHPVPSFNYLVEGTLEVTKQNGEKTLLQAGEAVVEVTNEAHYGRNVGDVPVRLIVFYAGVAGEQLTVAVD